jgi:nucleoside-diphosphate-sugar epimerase
MTRILVTGVRGFIGRALADELGKRGHEVIGSERTPESAAITGVRRMVSGDLFDREQTARIVAEAAAEVVVHLAARGVGMVADRRVDAFARDVTMTADLVAALRSSAARHLIFASSAAVYAAGSDAPIRETSEIRPASEYGAAKAAGEAHVRAFADASRAATVLRFANVIGAGELRPSVVSQISRQIAEAEQGGAATIRHGRLDEGRDFIDVADIASAIAACCELDASGVNTFNVGKGRAIAISDVVRMLAELARTPVRFEVDPSLVRSGPPSRIALDSSALRARVRWRPEIPLERSLAATLEFWRAAAVR